MLGMRWLLPERLAGCILHIALAAVATEVVVEEDFVTAELKRCVVEQDGEAEVTWPAECSNMAVAAWF